MNIIIEKNDVFLINILLTNDIDPELLAKNQPDKILYCVRRRPFV